MWNIIGILFVSACIFIIEALLLLKHKLWKDFIVFIIFLFLGTGLSIARCINFPIPNPIELLTWIYQPLSESVNKIFQ